MLLKVSAERRKNGAREKKQNKKQTHSFSDSVTKVFAIVKRQQVFLIFEDAFITSITIGKVRLHERLLNNNVKPCVNFVLYF